MNHSKVKSRKMVIRLLYRQRHFDNLKEKQGYTYPGSQKK